MNTHHRSAFETLAKTGSYFVYDIGALREHAAQVSQGAATLFFACKANPLGAVLSTLHEAGAGFDVASEGELLQVLSVGARGENIIVTGPGSTERFFSVALTHRVETFVIESPHQLAMLQKMMRAHAYKPKMLLRIQLQWEKGERNVLGGNSITPFGMDVNTARTLLGSMNMKCFAGFHVFQWDNMLCIDKLRSLWQHILMACRGIKRDFRLIDVGGGVGIPYQREAPLKWADVDALVKTLMDEHNLADFYLEAGRYLTGPYGWYITTVADRKAIYGRDMLVLAGGINHLARPVLLSQSFPATLLRKSQADTTTFWLHGPLCTSLDCLGTHPLPADTTIGDVIIFHQVGAYGFTESMPFFLCHHLPGEAVIKEGRLRIIRESQSAQSWLR